MADLTVTAASVLKTSGVSINGVAGETLTAGQSVYASAPGVYSRASKTSAALAAAIGIALNGGGASQPIEVQINGTINPGATVAVGKVYVVGTTGGIMPVDDIAGTEYITILGIGITTSSINMFNGPLASGAVAAGAVT